MRTLNLFIFSVVLNVISLPAFSQWSAYKFGKISNQELELQHYSKDTSANALVLFHDGYTSYQYLNNEFQVCTEVSKRIKIFKPEGTGYATVELRLYCNRNGCEKIDKVEAYAHNLENGKVVKSKLDKKYIFEEKVSENVKTIKFAIPNAKAGSVIEYRYNIISTFYYDMPNWTFQSEIPVQHARYEVLIPEYFQYNIESRGYESITTNETLSNQTFILRSSGNSGTDQISCRARKILYTMNDIPSMRDENHVWNVNDFKSGLRFELQGTQFPGDFYRPYTQNWDNVDKTISDNTSFNSYISKNNPYKKEIESLIAGIQDEREKIEAIYNFIKEKIIWDESYGFVSNPSDAIKNSKGDNAQINAVLLSAFKDAGITAYPILLSRRSRGRLPMSYPTIDQLNTFVVMAKDSEGKEYFMDGSAKYGGLNMLPSDLLVDRARIYSKEVADKWIDLTTIGKNLTVNLIYASVNSDGSVEGVYTSIYNDQPALSMKTSLNNLKDSAEYVEELENEMKVSIDSIAYENQKKLTANQMKRIIKFTKSAGDQNEYVYLNPMLFTHIEKNSFLQSDRKLPVEFNYPYSYRLTCSITIPDNYSIEELPRSGKIMLNENSGFMHYIIKQTNGKIELSYRLDLNQIIYPFNDYKSLQDFFAEVVSKNNALVVLKKKA